MGALGTNPVMQANQIPGINSVDDQFNKKQMEFKDGKLQQLITDQPHNSNMIHANTYHGPLGLLRFLRDAVFYFENFFLVVLAVLCFFGESYTVISLSYPVTALVINVLLAGAKMVFFEERQWTLTEDISKKRADYLHITNKSKKFVATSWGDLKPGYIIRVKNNQEFPGDCLILDVRGGDGQKCFVTAGPFDKTPIIPKMSFTGTASKTGTRQTEQQLAELLSGYLKYEYNYFGYIQGTFKLNENPAASEFNSDFVVQRGQRLSQTPQVICLVLNVGTQCMGSIYQDMDGLHGNQLKGQQRSFDRALRKNVKIAIGILFWLFFVLSIVSVSLGIESDSNQDPEVNSNESFDKTILWEDPEDSKQADFLIIQKFAGLFSVLLSSVPFSLGLIIDLLTIFHTKFAEWDINLLPSNLKFWHPSSILAFGRVGHIFFSRSAIQRNDAMCVKVLYLGGHYFQNNASPKEWNAQDQNHNGSEIEDGALSDESMGEDNNLEYLPNEAIFTKEFENEQVQQIISGPNDSNRTMILDFYRTILLCNSVSIIKLKLNEPPENVTLSFEELAALEFTEQAECRLVQKSKKFVTVQLVDTMERFEELGVVNTKLLGTQPITICAKRFQGNQSGILMMKCSLQAYKMYLQALGKDITAVSQHEKRFIKAGIHAVVYTKRDLTSDETNQLILAINEGAQSDFENQKLDGLLQNFLNLPLDLIGILGFQKSVHFRNRVAIDDFILNGIKPWIISQDDHQSHMAGLHSLRVFQNSQSDMIFEINGTVEREVMHQLEQALKSITDIMAEKSGRLDDDVDTLSAHTSRTNRTKQTSNRREKQNQSRRLMMDQKENEQQDFLNKKQIVLIFCGDALGEILKDKTMQKIFLTLASLSDIIIGSDVGPLQKQSLVKITNKFVREDENVISIISQPEDQFMGRDADIVVNLNSDLKATDVNAVADVTLDDFSALSYLLFKHGTILQLRLSQAMQGFVYKTVLLLLILGTTVIQTGSSGQMPYRPFYYMAVSLLLGPAQILIYAMFFKDYAYEYRFRIFGHYKDNYSFKMVQSDRVVLDFLSALFDFVIIYLPFQSYAFEHSVTKSGMTISISAFNGYQVLVTQACLFFYLKNSNVQVKYSINCLLGLSMIGCALIFDDDNLIGTQQIVNTPAILLIVAFQILTLNVKHYVTQVLSKALLRENSNLLQWYSDIEDRLSFEEYEDPNQCFFVEQYAPLFKKVKTCYIKKQLNQINSNLMNCPKTEEIEKSLDKINMIALDSDIRGSSSAVLNGAINKYTLRINDLNLEAQYSQNLSEREITVIVKHLKAFGLSTLAIALYNGIRYSFDNGVQYYLALTVFNFFLVLIVPHFLNYLQNILLVYSLVFMMLQSTVAIGAFDVHPVMFLHNTLIIMVLAYSSYYLCALLLFAYLLTYTLLGGWDEGEVEGVASIFNSTTTIIRGLIVLIWVNYAYDNELAKKIHYSNGGRKVREYLKFKSILNILVPALVRDKVQSGKKNFSEQEGQVTIVFIDINEFDKIVNEYPGSELIELMDKIYNVFDQLSDQFGLQKIETVGKTYMACGGLRQAEKKIDQKLLNKHHTVRVTDYAMEILKVIKTIDLKNRKNVQVKIGVHTGKVISGVVGDTKPQFSLIGDTVNKTSRVCSKAKPIQVTVSKETHHFLEEYTNNYTFSMTKVQMKGIGEEPIYTVMPLQGTKRKRPGKIMAKQQQQKKVTKTLDFWDEESDKQSLDQISEHGLDTNRQLMDEVNQMEPSSPDSPREGQQGLDHMNVFKFNDDLNLDDRQIVKNMTQNETFKLVERPPRLYSFEQKDREDEFLSSLQYKERKSNMKSVFIMGLFAQFVFIKRVTLFETHPFPYTAMYQLIAWLIVEVYLIFRFRSVRNGPMKFLTYTLIAYALGNMFTIAQLRVKTEAFSQHVFNSESIETILMLVFMARVVQFRNFVWVPPLYLALWAFNHFYHNPSPFKTNNKRDFVLFVICFIAFSVQLCISVHSREMFVRKATNYEKVLEVQCQNTNDLISKLVPYHQVENLKNEKKQVDEYDDATLLFTDMVGFTAFSKNVKDPKDVVTLLQKLFSRFDQLCDINKVYKVHTIGDCYVIMGYNGRISQKKRFQGVVIDEANRVIKSGLEMIHIIKEVRESDESCKDLNMRIGIHTGKVVAGIIGSKVVRYDIFGEGVLIANKMESNGIQGMVCISDDTKNLIEKEPTLAKQYEFSQHSLVKLNMIQKEIWSYSVTLAEPTILSSEEEEGQESEMSEFTEEEKDDSL